MRSRPIGLFDSGVGGLSVLRHVRSLLPNETLVYLADQAHVPYGPRPAAEIIALAHAITDFFITTYDVKLIVIPCNTASAAALSVLRQSYPDLPFVGMEPAVKPGALATRSGKVGVLATAGTFESQRYADLMRRFAQDVTLYENPCVGLVELIEAGATTAAETAALLHAVITPMTDAGVDTLVLGCTHYPFVMPLIADSAGPDVTIIDPAPAVARQVGRVLDTLALANQDAQPGATILLTTGDADRLAAQVEALLGWTLPAEHVEIEEEIRGLRD